MRVRVFGGFAVEGVAERDLGSRKGRTLLKLLAVARGTPVPVDRIADVIWGDDQPTRPADQVGVLISRLRGVLGSHRITRSDAGYALAVDWLDLDELEELAAAAASALADGRVGAARAAAGAALALARGPLLPDEDGIWVEAERAAATAAVRAARRVAVDAAAAAGDHAGAAAMGEQALADDPYDEVVLRALMRAHLAAGRPASALAAYARVRDRLAEDLGVPPTGETEAVYASALAAADGDTGPALARRSTVPLGIVGRDRELALLDAAVGEAVAGRRVLVVVEGEAGMGKTVLVDAWSARVADRAIVLRGRCDELGRDLPLQPVADALAAHLHAVGAERAAAILGPDAATLAPLLGPVAGMSATTVSDAEAGRERIFTALAAAIARAGGGQATVLLVEDLHLAGAGTLAWLAFFHRRSQRALLVVTAHPGAARGLKATHYVRLGPLDRDAVAALVGPDRAETLYERSGGHPLLLAALATAVDEELPATLPDAVAATVDALGSHVAATLRVAAILGAECDLDLIAQVSHTPTVEVLDHLEASARAGLVVERGSTFAFRHELVRQALSAAAGSARCALVHREAARVLTARSGADALAVAVHARAGGDVTLASASFVSAATVAASRFDLDAAEQYLAAALELAPTPEAYTARARVRMSRLALEAGAEDAERAIALGGGAAALEAAGWVAYYARHFEEARCYAEEAAARATDAPVRVSALALAGRVRHANGDLAGAREQLSAAHEGPAAVRGIADVFLSQVHVHQGRPVDALAALARPMVDPDSLAHPWAPLHLRFNRILALGQLGRVAEALHVAAEFDAAVEREGAVGSKLAAPAANTAAWILRWSGRTEEADERNWRAFEGSGGEAGPPDALAEGHYVALLDLADGCLLRGDVDGAAALEARLAPVDTWTGGMAWHQRHRLGLLRARLVLSDGDRDAAAGLAGAVATDAAARGAARYELLAMAVLGLADPDVPAERLDAVIERLRHCAALDGWPLVAALAAARHADGWRAEAERRAAAVVAAAGDHADAARRLVTRLLRV